MSGVPFDPAPVHGPGPAAGPSSAGPYGAAPGADARPEPARRPLGALAVVSLVCGILALPLAAIVCGHVALAAMGRQRRGGSVVDRGRPAAIAGLVLGYLGLLVLVALAVAVVLGSTWLRDSGFLVR